MTQVPKKHLPVLGLLGLVVIAASGGTIYYYQFVLPHASSCGVASHRLVFMTAQIQELGGFKVTRTAYLNQTAAPSFSPSKGANLTGVNIHDYKGAADNKTIDASVGDTITLYIFGVNATQAQGQIPGIAGHGFQITGPSEVTIVSGNLPSTGATIPFNQWYTLTFTVTATGTYLYFCTIPCSPLHGQMNGNIVVSCGG
jgi:plastocyanin